MKKRYGNPVKLLCVMAAVALGTACSKMDDYKEKYVPNGETTYTGKIDSVQIFSGRNRVKFKAKLNSDPRVTGYKVYWGGRADSITIPVSHTEPNGVIEQIISNVPESQQTFEFVTFDGLGNKSVSTFLNGTVYGSRYQESLLNRTLFGSSVDNALLTHLKLAVMDKSTGVFKTEIKYERTAGDSAMISVPLTTTDTFLLGHKLGTQVLYRTFYNPDSTCIDTFNTAYATYKPGPAWLVKTAEYMKNAGSPFLRASWDGSRWGILADWTTTAPVKNAGSNTYGGYELRNSVGVLSMEGGWGLPGIANGKIYQVLTLPAGKWKFTAPIDDLGAAGTKYIAMSFGTTLPDIANITTADKYVNFSAMAAGAQPSFEFETTGPSTQVCVGFVADMPNTGSYFKVKYVVFSWLLE